MSGQTLTGRKALVTGGARGIGAAIAAALGKAGASVMIGDVLTDLGQEMAADLATAGVRAGFVQLDVASDQQWEAAVAATIGAMGGYDILVNNAGVEKAALLIDIEAEDLLRMFDVNVLGTALGMKHAFRAMRPGGLAGTGGAVVNICSAAARISIPTLAAYSATKSAVERLTHIGAVEGGKLGYGVRVNCIYPGMVATALGLQTVDEFVALGLAPNVDAVMDDVLAQTPLRRLGEAADIANAAVFLASKEASFITGAGLPVDGGRTA